ncbi:MAG: hypothetical protein KJZ69_18980 [Phycisphaerales bacterium]|nr:hypothetical protein [Phycisphaerales bacterium]
MADPAKKPVKNVGEVGEDFVEWLCQAPLGRDFLFRGQKYPGPNGEIELCDLLVLLDDTAILIEVKTADREKRPDRTEEEWAEFANRRMKQALSQIERGVNAIRSGRVQQIENDRQGRVPIDPAKIRHVYGIAVVDHPTLDKWGGGPILECNGGDVSVLTTTHIELQALLSELSTVGDLVDYLQARELFFEKNQLMGVTELDLLATYKPDPERFREWVANHAVVVIGEGCWEGFEKLDVREQRSIADEPSLIVDILIDHLHESAHASLPHIDRRLAQLVDPVEPAAAYVTVVSELARIRRLDRRLIGEKLIEKSRKCVEQKRDRWFLSASRRHEHAACVFLVSTSGREERLQMLEMMTIGAMLKLRERRVLGIATEPVQGGYGFSIDAIMICEDPKEVERRLPPDMRDFLHSQFGPPLKSNATEFGTATDE